MVVAIATTMRGLEGAFAAVVGADVLHHVEMHEYLPRIRREEKPSSWSPEP